MPGDRFGIRRHGEPAEPETEPRPTVGPRPWWKRPAAIVLWVVLALTIIGGVAGDRDDPDRQDPVIDLDETPAQQEIVERCEAQLDAYFAAENPTKAEQLDFYQDCLSDAGYVEAGRP